MAIVAEYQQRLVGCGAIAGNVLKCIAIDPSLQGEGLSLKLLTELLTLAYELGRSELFYSLSPVTSRSLPAPDSGQSRRPAISPCYWKIAANG